MYLPGAGPWYDAQSGAHGKARYALAPLKLPDVTMDDVPSYLRGGHILPLRVRSWTLWLPAMAPPCSCLPRIACLRAQTMGIVTSYTVLPMMLFIPPTPSVLSSQCLP